MFSGTMDKYDRLASWALNKGPWEQTSKTVRKGIFQKKVQQNFKYESFPVDAISLWEATNRHFMFFDGKNIELEIENKKNILKVPSHYREDMETVQRIVALELAFVCMRTRSHLLEDIREKKFSHSDIEEGKNEGGILGNLLMVTSAVGLALEKDIHTNERKKEMEEAWRVASAILIPINALYTMGKNKEITDYSQIENKFKVSKGIRDVFLEREGKKLDSEYTFKI